MVTQQLLGCVQCSILARIFDVSIACHIFFSQQCCQQAVGYVVCMRMTIAANQIGCNKFWLYWLANVHKSWSVFVKSPLWAVCGAKQHWYTMIYYVIVYIDIWLSVCSCKNNTDMPPSGACDMSVLYVSTLPRYPLYSYVEVYIISMRYYIALMPHLLLLPKLSLTYDINLYLHLSHCSLPNAFVFPCFVRGQLLCYYDPSHTGSHNNFSDFDLWVVIWGYLANHFPVFVFAFQ